MFYRTLQHGRFRSYIYWADRLVSKSEVLNMRTTIAIFASLALGLFVGSAPARAEDPQPQSQPAAKNGDLVYEVVEVQGKAHVAPTGTDPLKNDGWTPIKVGDQLHAGQLVRVFTVRSKVKVVARPADPPTVMLFDRGTLVNISELAIVNGAAKSRIQLGYGQIKAGVAEGTVRSDMEIESPVATLSKRGTDIFGMEYGNGQYKMFLTDKGRGLIQAIQTQATAYGSQRLNEARFVTPGQFITHQLLRAIDNVQFDREVNVNDVFGLGKSDSLFSMLNDRGLGVFLNPNGTLQLSQPGGVPQPFQLPGEQPVVQRTMQSFVNPQVRQTPTNSGGDFGVGQGALPGFNSQSKLKAQLMRKVVGKTIGSR